MNRMRQLKYKKVTPNLRRYYVLTPAEELKSESFTGNIIKP